MKAPPGSTSAAIAAATSRRAIRDRGTPAIPLDAEDLATIHLDLLAVREGFERGK